MIIGSVNLNAHVYVEEIFNEYMYMRINYSLEKNNTLHVSIDVSNHLENPKGGISISIPELKSTNYIKKTDSRNFEKINIFKAGSKVWNNTLKKAVPSDYLLIEAWDNKWIKTYVRYVNFTLDIKDLKSLNLQIRSNLSVGKEKFATPLEGTLDQQGFPIHNIHIVVDEILERDKYYFRSETNEEQTKDTLYLVNKSKKQEKKILERKHINGNFEGMAYGCFFEDDPTFTKSGDLIANYSCAQGPYQPEMKYIFSKNGDLLKEIKLSE